MAQPAASEADTVPGTVADTALATASKVEAAPAFWAVDLAAEWADRDRSWGTAMAQVATARPTAGGGSGALPPNKKAGGRTTPAALRAPPPPRRPARPEGPPPPAPQPA